MNKVNKKSNYEKHMKLKSEITDLKGRIRQNLKIYIVKTTVHQK